MIQSSLNNNPIPRPKLFLLFFVSFFIWIFIARQFIFLKASLVSDAVAYYEHTKFFIDNLRQGVFPLWDPTRDCGVPIDLFLRRIGAYNPFYLIVIVFNMIGFSYAQSYMFFLAAYVFLGMIGFYRIAKHFLNDDYAAFFAFLLLFFSTLSTRIFDSYIILSFVPMTWFFVFLIDFIKHGQRYEFLGLTFCSMILVSTYIPFYFGIIFISFLAFTAIFYNRAFKKAASDIIAFIKQNKILVGFCLLAVILAAIPTFTLYKEFGTAGPGPEGEAELTLPFRHSGAEEKHVLSINTQVITDWGIVEDLVFAWLYSSNLHELPLGVVYIPFFAFIIFILASFLKPTRKLMFLLSWILTLFLMFSPYASGIYNFLHDRIFFFKYFRNLHFFLWFILLPLFVLFLAEQFRLLLNNLKEWKENKFLLSVLLVVIHLGLALSIHHMSRELWTTYLVIALSLVFFLWYGAGRLKRENSIFLPVIMGCVIVQPIAVYGYISKNTPNYQRYRYDNPYLKFLTLRDRTPGPLLTQQEWADLKEEENSKDKDAVDNSTVNKTALTYYGVSWTDFLTHNVNSQVLSRLRDYKFIVYDHIEWLNEKNLNFKRIQQAIADNEDTAYVISDRPQQPWQGTSPSYYAEIITPTSTHVQVVDYNVNQIKLKTSYDTKKFLVYLDSFHSGWLAFVNGKPVPIFRSHVAFKGIWLPAGENLIQFQFSPPWRHYLNLFLMGLFYLFFSGWIFITIQSIKKQSLKGKRI